MADEMDYLNNLIDQGNDSNSEVDVEMGLLALCMRKDTAILKTVENKIDESDFTDVRNRTIYGVIIDMFLDNAQIDRITVFSELERRGLADKAGGQRYVYRVGDTTAVQSALLSYIDAIRERSDRSKLLKTVEDVRKKALDGSMRATETADYAISKISELRGAGESKGFEGMADILKLTMSEITSELRDDNSGKIKLGFPKLDSMLGGLRPGSLNILAARPSMGKSALAINMAQNVAANQKPVAIFSLEMSKSEIATRLMSSFMSKPVSEIIYSRKMSDSDRKQIDRALGYLTEYPIYIDDNSDTNPVTMKSKLTQLFADPKKAPKLVVIDYLQLMTMPGGGGKSRNEEVTAISRSLKILAKDFNIPIIALSQLSRGAAQRDDHTPQLSDLRDSGAIEQDADTVMFIDRPDYYKKKDEEGTASPEEDEPHPINFKDGKEAKPAFIYLQKNRHGKTGRDSVWWIPSKTMFYEYNEKDPSEDSGSSYTRTVDGDTASQNYNFDSVTTDEAPIPEPPMPDNDDVPPEKNEGGDDFFAQTN
ncbi:MAG: replicative DNA helicase, partial [Clostridiales bacterium]|nr:replicative DNA helicase [Clostridiales bacterium]